jgi:hypothetical protein
MAATLLGVTGFAARAQTPDLPISVSLWDSTFTARAGGGYKDNVLLAHIAPEGSPFVSAGAEAMVFRLGLDPLQVSLFGSADASHYFTAPPANDEYTAFVQGQLDYDWSETWRTSFGAQYFYQDQILDVSASETNRQSVRAIGNTVSLRPGARMALSVPIWLALETPVTRQWFEAPLDDYWAAGAKLAAGFNYGRDSEVSLSYGPSWEYYDTEPARDSAGQAIPGEKRERFFQEARLTWRHYWDEPKRWRTTVTLGSRLNHETGGYWDYTRWSAGARMVYRAKPWELSGEARVSRYAYENQTVSATDPSLRRRTECTAEAQARRILSKHLTLAGTYAFEEVFSNDTLEAYTVNTVSLALEWEF